MILRRLSEQLKAQNWTAVALEFTIVLLGVVIGFQITAWNAARQDRNLERSYYGQLIVDLEADTATARRGIASADRGDQHAEMLLALIETGAAAGTGDADLIRAVLFAGYATLPRATRGSYDELISTGHLRLIRDEGLKRDLSRYYERMENARQWDDLVRVDQIAYRTAARGLLNRQQLIWARQAVRPDVDPASAPPLEREALIAGARARPELPGTLAAMGEVQERLRYDSRFMAEEAAALMDRLRAALDGRAH